MFTCVLLPGRSMITSVTVHLSVCSALVALLFRLLLLLPFALCSGPFYCTALLLKTCQLLFYLGLQRAAWVYLSALLLTHTTLCCRGTTSVFAKTTLSSALVKGVFACSTSAAICRDELPCPVCSYLVLPEGRGHVSLSPAVVWPSCVSLWQYIWVWLHSDFHMAAFPEHSQPLSILNPCVLLTCM